MKLKSVSLFALLGVIAACGGPPAPGDAAYPFNLSGTYEGTIGVDGQGFAVVAEFVTEKGGIVSGTFQVTQPVEIGGTLEGTLLGSEAELTFDYRNNPMTGCSGTVVGTVRIDEGGGTLRGDMTVTDCGDQLEANMLLRRGS